LDTYGFSALPGGSRDTDGGFPDVGNYGDWWSASEGYASDAYGRGMRYSSIGAFWYNIDKAFGFSVRCLQD
jgi:uncharacterized protein (TIGR02145 family)